MNSVPKKDSALEGILDEVWVMLQNGAKQSDDPFHIPVLGTIEKAGCGLRTVILRHVQVSERILICHTDARSPKVQEIMNCPQVNWLFYHPQKKVQLRVSGRATLHAHDPLADRQWRLSGLTSRLNYCASEPPGTPLENPSSGLPDFLRNKIPTLLETKTGRKNFMVISARVDAIDWLKLKLSGNRRARFQWDQNRLYATWLVP